VLDVFEESLERMLQELPPLPILTFADLYNLASELGDLCTIFDRYSFIVLANKFFF